MHCALPPAMRGALRRRGHRRDDRRGQHSTGDSLLRAHLPSLSVRPRRRVIAASVPSLAASIDVASGAGGIHPRRNTRRPGRQFLAGGWSKPRAPRGSAPRDRGAFSSATWRDLHGPSKVRLIFPRAIESAPDSSSHSYDICYGRPGQEARRCGTELLKRARRACACSSWIRTRSCVASCATRCRRPRVVVAEAADGREAVRRVRVIRDGARRR